MAGQVHYEIFFRKTAPSGWTLLQATEDRKQAIHLAEDMLADKQAVAVRVTKETLDPESMSFDSVTILDRGMPEPVRRTVERDETARPMCQTPAEIYAPHPRELIGRALEDWLARHGVTTFELLHRPDLVERLEASGVELQHAVQKIAVPESQASGLPLHALMRHYQKLAEQSAQRVVDAGRRGVFVDLANRSLADLAQKMEGVPDRAFVMGGILCRALVGVKGARARLDRLMDLIDRAPAEGPARAMVMVPIEQILSEMLGSRRVLAEILGPDLDQGAALTAAVRMVAPREIEMLTRADARMAAQIPALDPAVGRLGARLESGEFPLLAAAIARMVLRELMGPRRLRPANARGEIDVLRALAMSLTATTGRLLSLEEVQQAFVERSRALVAADFVAAYVSKCETVICEAEHLTRLCENVTGVANKRAAARWLEAVVGSLRFETEMRTGAAGQAGVERLAVLARLQRSVRAAALSDHDERQITEIVGVVGGQVEAEARLTQAFARSPAPPGQKLSALLRMAAGETAPLGPAAERARMEALRLFRSPEARAALAESPESLTGLKPLLKAVGLAA